MLRPYTVPIQAIGDGDDPVQVIRHHDEGVQGDIGEVFRDLEPALFWQPCRQH